MDKIKELEEKLLNAYKNGAPDKRVIELIEELQYLDKDNVTLLNILCDIYTVDEDYNQAFAFAKRALEVDNDNAIALYNMGMIYYGKKNYEKAIEYLNKSIKDEIKEEVCNILGDCYYEINELDKALEFYDKALSKKSDDEFYIADIEFKVGNIFFDKEEYENALKHFEIAHELDVEEPVTINNIGLCYEMLNDFNKALSYYEKAHKIDLEDEMFINNIKTIKEKM